MPTIPSNKDYQLWAIKGKKPTSAGVFSVSSEKQKENFFQVLNLAVRDRRDVDAFAVTLEPKGGLPQPSGPMYLLGSL